MSDNSSDRGEERDLAARRPQAPGQDFLQGWRKAQSWLSVCPSARGPHPTVESVGVCPRRVMFQ